ncbi:MAG: GNAT family N-acetyltransferase [Candidatus Burarchaeum sp.]|nr:GNAT family N-acetyltransferase [Candidatus Burarchaeum sp.]MDO8339660.1 GNAT family N-acetyltransferase [Candidatus Burarchaeum sp.]
MKLEVKRANYAKDKDTIHDIRTRVFVLEQNVTQEEEVDGLDESAIHVIAYADGKPVGTARMLELESGPLSASGGKGPLSAKQKVGGAKLGRMAVLRQYRDKGAGAAMARRLIEMARAMGMKEVVLDAQVDAIGFYEKLGFIAEGSVFMDARIEHRKMRLKL